MRESVPCLDRRKTPTTDINANSGGSKSGPREGSGTRCMPQKKKNAVGFFFFGIIWGPDNTFEIEGTFWGQIWKNERRKTPTIDINANSVSEFFFQIGIISAAARRSSYFRLVRRIKKLRRVEMAKRARAFRRPPPRGLSKNKKTPTIDVNVNRVSKKCLQALTTSAVARQPYHFRLTLSIRKEGRVEMAVKARNAMGLS